MTKAKKKAVKKAKSSKKPSQKKAKKKGKRLGNMAELALFLGVSISVISRDWIPKGCPCVQKGGNGKSYIFDFDEVAKWREATMSKTAKSGSTLSQAQERRINADADLKEMELQKRRGELVELLAVEKVWTSVVVAIRSKFRAMPSKLAPVLAVKRKRGEIKNILEREIDATLAELADATYDTATGGSRQTPATAKSTA